MRFSCLRLLGTSLLCGTLSSFAVENFDTTAVGEIPSGWVVAQTGKGTPVWKVTSDSSAPSGRNVLEQSGVADYPLCLVKGSSLRDGQINVRFKAISGKDDQAAGVVWRARDADNYYVCRANALEGNVVLYKTVQGRRSSLDIVGRKGGYGVKKEVPPEVWHTLSVSFNGPKFEVALNGEKLFEVEDSTFAAAGMVGLWTKADSVTLFDDFDFGPK